LISEVWRIVVVHKVHDWFVNPVRTLPIAPKPFGNKSRNAKHPEMNEDSNFCIIIPLVLNPGLTSIISNDDSFFQIYLWKRSRIDTFPIRCILGNAQTKDCEENQQTRCPTHVNSSFELIYVLFKACSSKKMKIIKIIEKWCRKNKTLLTLFTY